MLGRNIHRILYSARRIEGLKKWDYRDVGNKVKHDADWQVFYTNDSID